jgi:hypothetical protein
MKSTLKHNNYHNTKHYLFIHDMIEGEKIISGSNPSILSRNINLLKRRLESFIMIYCLYYVKHLNILF